MKSYKHYKCKSCRRELYGVDPVFFYTTGSDHGKVSSYICSACKRRLGKSLQTFRAYTSYTGFRKHKH